MNISSFLIGYQAGKKAGGGSGGGTLPAGVYLNCPVASPSNYPHKMFMLNGTLYATCADYATGGYIHKISKWNGSSWETVLSSTSSGINGNVIDSVSWCGAELDGVMHIIDGKQHWLFDGTTFVASTSFLNYETSATVWQGRLYVKSDTNKTLYEWDTINNAWITHEKLSSYGDIVSVNDELYNVGSSGISRYDNGVLSQVCTCPYFSYLFAVDGNLYGIEMNGNLYKVDLASGEHVKLGSIGRFQCVYGSIGTNDISFTVATYTSNNYCPFFVVHIVESAE